MWLILLDHSGSMGEPFHGTAEFQGRSKPAEQAVKLDAAKAAIVERLLGMSVTDIAIFGFTGTAVQVFEGPSNRRTEIEAALNGLQADNGTNIAAALDAAREYVEVRAPRIIRVLAVTDGLSDAEEARQAAERISQLGGIIDVVLIDPTPEGELVARSINFNGEVTAVTSPERIDEVFEERAKQHAALAKQAEEFASAFECEAASVQAKQSQKERLAFSIAYPRSVTPAQWYSFLVYVHLEQLRETVLDMLERRAAQIRLRHSVAEHSASKALERGTVILLVPQVPGVDFNPVSLRFAWVEDIHEVSFRMQVPANSTTGPLLGSIDVHAEVNSASVLIGRIPLSIRVRDEDEVDEPDAIRADSGRVFERVFASYSTKDAALVESCVDAYEALGIYVYLDKYSLRNSTGLEFLPLLKGQIDKSDLFQLYWSTNSKASQYVDKEWRHAHSILGIKGDRFILPVCWEDDWPPLPDELSRFQCKRLHASKTTIQSGGSESDSSGRLTPVLADLNVPVTVLPLLPGSAEQVDQGIKSDIQAAVRFGEEVTGLRYYPVPTLLLDDHIVASVRRNSTIDWKCPRPATVECAVAAADVLSSLALEFHVNLRDCLPNNMSREGVRRAFGEGDLLTAEQFNCMQRYCEGFIKACVRDILLARVPFYRESPYEQLPARGIDEPLPAFVRRVLQGAVDEFASGASRRSNRLVGDPDVERVFVEPLETDLRAAGVLIQDSFLPGRVRLQANHSDNLKFLDRICGPASGFVADIERLCPTAPQNPDSLRRVAATCRIAGAILEHGLEWNSPNHSVPAFLHALAIPHWRECRDELASRGVPGISSTMHFGGFLRSYCETVQMLFEKAAKTLQAFTYSSEFGIRKQSWDRFLVEHPNVVIDATERHESNRDGATITLSGELGQYANVFRAASNILLRSMSCVSSLQTHSQEYFTTMVPTHGIFVGESSEQTDAKLDSWALALGIPTELVMRGSPRVLFCLNSLERFRDSLERDGKTRHDALRLAREFQRCVLVHEHFHAILETGLDAGGKPARGPRFADAWSASSCLNEALAAWMELHFSRGNPELHELVRAFVSAGEYPDWPYRGAERLEALFQRHGIDAIRVQIDGIRGDPETAQAAFDACDL